MKLEWLDYGDSNSELYLGRIIVGEVDRVSSGDWWATIYTERAGVQLDVVSTSKRAVQEALESAVKEATDG